ncbi:MAG: hypothetical protein Q8K60_06050 [Parachlamydiaceae bacterium]|nr:hypothetical protein [Parachlamydiaceae bacterium]
MSCYADYDQALFNESRFSISSENKKLSCQKALEEVQVISDDNIYFKRVCLTKYYASRWQQILNKIGGFVKSDGIYRNYEAFLHPREFECHLKCTQQDTLKDHIECANRCDEVKEKIKFNPLKII